MTKALCCATYEAVMRPSLLPCQPGILVATKYLRAVTSQTAAIAITASTTCDHYVASTKRSPPVQSCCALEC